MLHYVGKTKKVAKNWVHWRDEGETLSFIVKVIVSPKAEAKNEDFEEEES